MRKEIAVVVTRIPGSVNSLLVPWKTVVATNPQESWTSIQNHICRTIHTVRIGTK